MIGGVQPSTKDATMPQVRSVMKPKRYFADTIYSGCHFEEIEKYKDGLRTANLALITQVPQKY